jgi:Zn-dependent peptidase ImmA (M78 family)
MSAETGQKSSTVQALAMKGMQASISARTKAGIDLKSPICIYDLCEKLKVIVRFNDINMEGMYDREPKPRIHLSSLRPLARRAFTCAHELGHHIFGHGSTIDELNDSHLSSASRPPEEVLADAFGAFVLMPTLGVKEAFHLRNLDPNKASPLELFAIACSFGVGQATLVNHLAYALKLINPVRRDQLGKVTPKAIRSEILGEVVSEPLTIVDHHWLSPTLDMEEGALVLLPAGVALDITVLMPEKELASGRLFRATKTGITRVVLPGTSWALYVRVSRKRYVGLARFRHLEDASDD